VWFQIVSQLLLRASRFWTVFLVGNEAVDEARRLKKEMLLFKVDFEKAYNSVDLNYLDMVCRE